MHGRFYAVIRYKRSVSIVEKMAYFKNTSKMFLMLCLYGSCHLIIRIIKYMNIEYNIKYIASTRYNIVNNNEQC